MKKSVYICFAFLLSAGVTHAKVLAPQSVKAPPSAISESSLLEELTGQKSATSSAAQLKKSPLPVQHFMAGQKAAEEKNYILAIKHFNTVLKKYPRSQQVRPALLAKAKIYREMGLKNQAEHNLKMAQMNTIQKSAKKTTQTAKSSERVKSVK